jgi:hypothetical protein
LVALVAAGGLALLPQAGAGELVGGGLQRAEQAVELAVGRDLRLQRLGRGLHLGERAALQGHQLGDHAVDIDTAADAKRCDGGHGTLLRQ